MAFIEATNIVKDYSGHKALDNFNLNVDEGCIYGLLGPNGAGKSTFIRILNQITMPDSGKIMFNGHKLCRNDISNIGYLPEERGLYPKMKVGEQAIYLAQLKGLSYVEAKRRLIKWFDKFDITSWWNKNVSELSKGMQQKIQFITTVLHEPKVLIFDEPFSGFDPINAELLKQEIIQLKNNGATVLFSTHNMASVEEICDNITLLNKSKSILSGRVSEIKEQFKENTFMLKFKGTPDSIQHLPINIIDSNTDNMQTTLKISFDKSINSNEILRQIIECVDIISYEETLPSMNNIFIKVVEENNYAKQD